MLAVGVDAACIARKNLWCCFVGDQVKIVGLKFVMNPEVERNIQLWLLVCVCVCYRCILRVTNWWAPTAISGSWHRFCCLHTPSAPRDTWLPWRRWSALSRGGGRLHLVRIDFYRLNTLTRSQHLNHFIFTNYSQCISKNDIKFYSNHSCIDGVAANRNLGVLIKVIGLKCFNHFMDLQRVAYQRISQRAVR